MHSKWLPSLLIGIGLAVSSSAQASGSASGLITYFVPFVSGGVEMFAVRLTTMSTLPACNTATRFVMSAADPKFRTTVAALLGAHFSGTSIFIHGQGTCTTYDNASEDLAYICLGTDPC